MLFRPDRVLRNGQEGGSDAGGDGVAPRSRLEGRGLGPTGETQEANAGSSGVQPQRPDDAMVTGKTGAEKYHRLRADSFAREAQLTALDAAVQESIARDEQVAFEGEAKRLEEFQQEMAELQQQALNSSLQQAAQVQKLGEEIGNMYPRPGRLFQDSSAAATWGAAMSLAAASFQSSRTGGPNAALGIIQQAIQQDIAAQEIEYDAKKTELGAAQTVYQELRQAYGDAQQAKNAQSAILMEAARHRLEAASRMAKTKPVDLGGGLSMSHYEMQAQIASQKLIQARNEQLIKMAEKTYEIKSRGGYRTAEGRLAEMLGRLGDPALLAQLKEGQQDFDTLGRAAQAGQARAAQLAQQKKQQADQDGAKADVAVNALKVAEANGAQKAAPEEAPVEEASPDVGADDQRPIDWNRADLVDPEMREWSFEKQAAQDARDAAQAAASAARDQSEADAAAVAAAEAEVARIEGLKPPKRSGRYGAVDPREVASEKEFGRPGPEAERKWNVALADARAALDGARDAATSSSRAREESEASLASAEQAFQQSRGVADERRAQEGAERQAASRRSLMESGGSTVQADFGVAKQYAARGRFASRAAQAELDRSTEAIAAETGENTDVGRATRQTLVDSLPLQAAVTREQRSPTHVWTAKEVRDRMAVISRLGGTINAEGLPTSNAAGFEFYGGTLQDVKLSDDDKWLAGTAYVNPGFVPVVFGVGMDAEGRPQWSPDNLRAIQQQLGTDLMEGAPLKQHVVYKQVWVEPAAKYNPATNEYVSGGAAELQTIALPAAAVSAVQQGATDPDAYSFSTAATQDRVTDLSGGTHILKPGLTAQEKKAVKDASRNSKAVRRLVAAATLAAAFVDNNDEFARSWSQAITDQVEVSDEQMAAGWARLKKRAADGVIPRWVMQEITAEGAPMMENGKPNWNNKLMAALGVENKDDDEHSIAIKNFASGIGSISHLYGFMAPQRAELQLITAATGTDVPAVWEVFHHAFENMKTTSSARQFANDIDSRMNAWLEQYTYSPASYKEAYAQYAKTKGGRADAGQGKREGFRPSGGKVGAQ